MAESRYTTFAGITAVVGICALVALALGQCMKPAPKPPPRLPETQLVAQAAPSSPVVSPEVAQEPPAAVAPPVVLADAPVVIKARTVCRAHEVRSTVYPELSVRYPCRTPKGAANQRLADLIRARADAA